MWLSTPCPLDRIKKKLRIEFTHLISLGGFPLSPNVYLRIEHTQEPITHVNFTHVNKIKAMFRREGVTGKRRG